MDRFFAGRTTAKPAGRRGEGKSESLSSWTEIWADAWQLTDPGLGSITDRGSGSTDGQPDARPATNSRNNLASSTLHDTQPLSMAQVTNGFTSLPLDTGGGATASLLSGSLQGRGTTGVRVGNKADEIDGRLTQSLDLGHDSLQRLTSEAGVNDSLSTSSMDYLWDAEEVPDAHKFNSLPHSGGYSTTSNGSLPGSPLTIRRQQQSVDATDGTDKIKTKLMAAWNNMRHGWTMRRKTSFKYDDPIWMLGIYYHNTTQEREDIRARQQRGLQVITSMERFKRDFSSRLWFTYRQNFAPLTPYSQYTTDVGWGCMIRTGQMMLAHALLMHYLGREWRWYPQQRPQEVIYHHQIIRLFGDAHSNDCPFSLHKLVEIGQRSGKSPGDWYGPASVAYVLSEAVLQAPTNPLASQICVYVAQDCTVYRQDVFDLCAMMGSRRSSFRARHGSSNSDDTTPLDSGTCGAPVTPTPDEPWKALVILIPVRLGGESLNEAYIPCVQSMLTHRMCLGVIGGKPKHSVYFVGWQADKLIYLDPHFCQDAVDITDRHFPVHSYHCMSPRKLQANKMDPSCTIGFFCKTRVDFETFVREAPQFTAPSMESGHYPMFAVVEGRSLDVTYMPTPRASSSRSSDKPGHKVSNDHLSTRMRVSSKESDDFVFL